MGICPAVNISNKGCRARTGKATLAYNDLCHQLGQGDYCTWRTLIYRSPRGLIYKQIFCHPDQYCLGIGLFLLWTLDDQSPAGCLQREWELRRIPYLVSYCVLVNLKFIVIFQEGSPLVYFIQDSSSEAQNSGHPPWHPRLLLSGSEAPHCWKRARRGKTLIDLRFLLL